MYKRVLLLISVQRWEWETRGHAQWMCWGGGGCAWARQWFFVLGWRWRMGNAVVSADQWVLWGEQSNAESLPLHHPTGHARMIAASCVQIFLNDLEGQNQFSVGRKEGCEGSSLTSKSLNKSRPILPLKGAFSTPSLGEEGRLGQCRVSRGCLMRNKQKRSLL